MIQCTPKGICSWDFYLDGDGHQASLEFDWFSEQGRLLADGTSFEIHKHGVFSGHWTLDRAGEQVVTAQKSNPFTRTFDIEDSQGPLLLRAESPFGRTFNLARSGQMLATIAPVHPFTRRATIETLAAQYNFVTLAFSFWLAVLTWRRQRNNSSGG